MTAQVRDPRACLVDVMAPDVVLIADGGGIAAAALAPVHGAGLVARVPANAS